MATLNYFQLYSQKENTVTNNLLLLFSRIYEISPKVYNEFIVSLLEDENAYSVQLSFEQQIKIKNGRVPDGRISLKSSSIVIETKLESTEDFDQLLGHCAKFEDEDYQILILITKTNLREDNFKKAKDTINEKYPSVKFFSISHTDIIDVLKKLTEDYPFERELNSLLNHYSSYCELEDLLPNEEFLMRVVPCGPSWDLNRKYHFYFDQAERGNRKHRFIGFYWGKSIRAIGELKSIVSADLDLLKNKLIIKDNNQLGVMETEHLSDAISASVKAGWRIEKDHKFFLLKDFIEIDFKKSSKNPIRGPIYLDLRNFMSKEQITISQNVAQYLDGKKWEDSSKEY